MTALTDEQGGGYVLDFCTKPQYATHVAKLSGIIALGPLLLLTFPAPTLKVWAVRAVSRIVPWMTIPAPMPEEVSNGSQFHKMGLWSRLTRPTEVLKKSRGSGSLETGPMEAA